MFLVGSSIKVKIRFCNYISLETFFCIRFLFFLFLMIFSCYLQNHLAAYRQCLRA